MGGRSAGDFAADLVGDGGTVARLGGRGPFDPGRRGLKALAAVATVVIAIAGVTAWRMRPEQDPVAAAPGPAVSLPTSVTAEAGSSAPAEIVVAVAGKVRRPGLVRLPGGARVADAIAGAGGAVSGADLSMVNLARRVVDGELILIGVGAPAGTGPAGAVGPAGGGTDPAGAPVSLNAATLSQLDALPGVGPVLAQRILDYRGRHGGFRSVAELRQVEGIGQARYEQLKDLVTV